MSRSTKSEKARQLNAARSLLERQVELSEAAQKLSRKYGMSRRQAYRYLEEAAQLPHPVEVVEAAVPITLKLRPRTVRELRSYARRSGMTMGEIVSRALQAFLGTLRRHG